MNQADQILAFHLDERRFGVALSQVQRVVRAVDITPLPQAPGIVLGIISLGGQIVPVLNTRKRFGIAQREVNVDDQFMIATTRRRTVALVVDGVKGIITYPADKIVVTEEFLHPLRQVQGLIQLEDGLILIHDLDRFLSLDEESELEQSLVGQTEHAS
jgi:purine-binding chemotaxis protein CheW